MNPHHSPPSTPRISRALRQPRMGFGSATESPRAARELRRFVPPQRLERIDRGGRIDVGETCASVLVAGFHGTTTYAAARKVPVAVDPRTHETASAGDGPDHEPDRRPSWTPTTDADGNPEAFLLSWHER